VSCARCGKTHVALGATTGLCAECRRATADAGPGPGQDIGYGTCPVCGSAFSVLSNGTLARHGGKRLGQQCKGSGQPPAGEVISR
jgi:hypothetical protein